MSFEKETSTVMIMTTKATKVTTRETLKNNNTAYKFYTFITMHYNILVREQKTLCTQ